MEITPVKSEKNIKICLECNLGAFVLRFWSFCCIHGYKGRMCRHLHSTNKTKYKMRVINTMSVHGII